MHVIYTWSFDVDELLQYVAFFGPGHDSTCNAEISIEP